ncbi:MAG: aspartyl/glutamyl-tRNA amidotransferase subunit A, partial [Synergistaceae bacterium]|nr:aspartyl/glutamyl-tRNA amidotransferase subunit A [Synergistaceae bacterium]
MELYELNLWMLMEGLKAGNFSASEIFESCKKRIDQCEENIHALITRTDDVMPSHSDGILAGIPTIIKDNLCTKGLRTTAASRILGNWKPPYDATAWARLRDAGAVLMGKANMDEFAMGNTCGNSAFGPTRNPNDISLVPGGSSGGSAAAVSAGYVPFSLGSDTGGSIRQPASFCGVYGLKPTYGMVSRYGLISYGSSLDQIGPFARTVRDLQTVMSVISGHDPMDSSSFRDKAHDFTHNENVSIEGKKIAVVKEFENFTLDAPIADAMTRVKKVLEDEGAIITEVSLPVVSKYAVACYYALAMSEAHTNLERYDGVRLGYTVKDATGIKEMFERVRSYGFGAEVKARIIAGT